MSLRILSIIIIKKCNKIQTEISELLVEVCMVQINFEKLAYRQNSERRTAVF